MAFLVFGTGYELEDLQLQVDLMRKRTHAAFQACKKLSCSVAPFSLFFGGCPTKIGLPQKGIPFFSRVTEQLGKLQAVDVDLVGCGFKHTESVRRVLHLTPG